MNEPVYIFNVGQKFTQLVKKFGTHPLIGMGCPYMYHLGNRRVSLPIYREMSILSQFLVRRGAQGIKMTGRSARSRIREATRRKTQVHSVGFHVFFVVEYHMSAQLTGDEARAGRSYIPTSKYLQKYCTQLPRTIFCTIFRTIFHFHHHRIQSISPTTMAFPPSQLLTSLPSLGCRP